MLAQAPHIGFPMDFPSRSALEDGSELRWVNMTEQYHTSVTSSAIHRRVTIRSKPSSLMANYSKIKRVEPPWSCLATAVEENWNTEE